MCISDQRISPLNKIYKKIVNYSWKFANEGEEEKYS